MPRSPAQTCQPISRIEERDTEAGKRQFAHVVPKFCSPPVRRQARKQWARLAGGRGESRPSRQLLGGELVFSNMSALGGMYDAASSDDGARSDEAVQADETSPHTVRPSDGLATDAPQVDGNSSENAAHDESNTPHGRQPCDVSGPPGGHRQLGRESASGAYPRKLAAQNPATSGACSDGVLHHYTSHLLCTDDGAGGEATISARVRGASIGALAVSGRNEQDRIDRSTPERPAPLQVQGNVGSLLTSASSPSVSGAVLNAAPPNDDASKAASSSAQPGPPASTAEAVSILIDKMLESPTDEDLHTRAMRSLRRLSTSDEGRALIGDSGGVQLVSDCLRRFTTNVNLATACCMVIANLSYGSQENKDRARRSRAIDSIIDLLGSTDLSSDSTAFVCLAARNLSNGCQKNQIYLGTYGGVDGLCKAMRRNPEHVEVQLQAIAAAANISHGNKSCQLKMRETGAIELILQAMRRNSTDGAVQETCLVALRNLCVDNERNQRAVGALGGVDQTVLAMRAFPRNSTTQVRACAALRYLAFDGQNRERIGVNGGVVSIVDALQAVRADSEGIDEVLKALSNATFDHAENKLAVHRCGGIQSMMDIMSADGSAPALEGGFRVLRNLTDCSEDVRQAIREGGAVSIAVDCLRRRRPEAGIIEHALALLLNLVVDGLSAAGAGRDTREEELISLTRQAMEQFPEHLAILDHGAALVHTLQRAAGRAADADGGGRMFKRKTHTHTMPKILRKMSSFARTASDRSGAVPDLRGVESTDA